MADRWRANRKASLACTRASATDQGSADEAVALVKTAVADLRKHGREKVKQDVQNQAARYRDRDLYVVTGTIDGVSVANGSNLKSSCRHRVLVGRRAHRVALFSV